MDKYTYQGPDGTNPVVGRVYKGRIFDISAMPASLAKEWVAKKWLVAEVVAKPSKKEVE